MYGPHKLYLMAVRLSYEFCQLLCLFLWIGVTPMGSVIGVILGPVDIDVQFVLSVELKLAYAISVAPRVAIEALYDSTASHTGPVLYTATHDLLLTTDFQERLHSIISACSISPRYDHALGFHTQVISFGL